MPEDSAAKPDAAVAKPLSFEVEESGDSALVKCKGRLVAGTCDAFTAEMKPLLASKKKLVIDLANLAYVDSMGLGSLVRIYVSSRSSGGEFKLLNLGKQVRNVIRLTNLSSVLGDTEGHGISVA